MDIQNDSTKVTFTQVYQDVKEGLTALGEALKVGAEHVYEVLVKQQFVNSISLSITLAVITIASISVLIYGFKRGIKEGWCDETSVPLTIFGSIFTLVSLVCIICYISEIITGFINPEYGAMKEIMEFVK